MPGRLGRWGAGGERKIAFQEEGTTHAQARRDASLSFRSPTQVYLWEQTP